MAKGDGKKRTARNIKARKRLWPNLSDSLIWDWKDRGGFATIPRTLPYFFRIMDSLSKNKPLSSTYLALWCRLWDESCLIKVDNPIAFAKESGFSGQRALSTWRSRIKKLDELGFIKTKSLAGDPYGYILILSPYYAAKNLYDTKKYTDEGWFNALWERHNDVGAEDLDELEELEATAKRVADAKKGGGKRRKPVAAKKKPR